MLMLLVIVAQVDRYVLIPVVANRRNGKTWPWGNDKKKR